LHKNEAAADFLQRENCEKGAKKEAEAPEK